MKPFLIISWGNKLLLEWEKNIPLNEDIFYNFMGEQNPFKMGTKYRPESAALLQSLAHVRWRGHATMTNTSNGDTSLFSGVPWMIIYICETALITTGNLITVCIFWKIRKRLKRTSYLLINVTIADITVGIALALALSQGIATMMEKEVSLILKKPASTIDSLGVTSSLLSLALISLERMSAVVWPFRHRMLSAWYYHISVAMVWSIASLNAYVTLQFNLYSARVDSPLRFLMAITLISSVVVIVASYLTIWIAAKRNQLPRRASRTTEQNRKLAKSLLTTTAVSTVTFLPNNIYFCFSDYLQHLYSFAVQITLVTQYSNSFLNPIVYSIKIPEFRMSLKKSVFCRCRPRPKPLSFNDYTLANTSSITLQSVKQFE